MPDSAFTNDYTLHDNHNEQSFLFEQEIKSMFPDYNIFSSFEDTFKINHVPIYDRNENSDVLLEKPKKKFIVEDIIIYFIFFNDGCLIFYINVLLNCCFIDFYFYSKNNGLFYE